MQATLGSYMVVESGLERLLVVLGQVAVAAHLGRHGPPGRAPVLVLYCDVLYCNVLHLPYGPCLLLEM